MILPWFSRALNLQLQDPRGTDSLPDIAFQGQLDVECQAGSSLLVKHRHPKYKHLMPNSDGCQAASCSWDPLTSLSIFFFFWAIDFSF